MAKNTRTKPPSKPVRFLLRVKAKLVRGLTKPLRWLVARLARYPRTAGEAAFETYMRENGIRFTYEVQEEGKARRPDYTIILGARKMKIDVKDLEDKALDLSMEVDDERLSDVAQGVAEDDGQAIEVLMHGGAYNPHAKLREKVNTARAQVKEYKDVPCAVVFHTEGHGADLRSGEVMLGVMYGNYGVSIPFNPERGDFVGTQPEFGFQTGGSVVHRRKMSDEARIQNTTISALITLREVKVGVARLAEYVGDNDDRAATFDTIVHGRLKVDEVHYGVIVWENVFAANPLPEGIFRGPYDEYWSAKKDQSGNELTHFGDKLKWTLERFPEAISPLKIVDDDERTVNSPDGGDLDKRA